MLTKEFISEFAKKKSDKKINKILSNIPHGSEPLIIFELWKHLRRDIIFIAENKKRYNQIKDILNFLNIEDCHFFPEYDTNIYDRISPNKNIKSERVKSLIDLNEEKEPKLVLTTAQSSIQYLVDKSEGLYKKLSLDKNSNYNSEDIIKFLSDNGYNKVSYVREIGDYTVRGGIIDYYSHGSKLPIRLDFFGDKLEIIREFDPITQISSKEFEYVSIYPCNEIILNKKLIERFRSNFNQEFGSKNKESKLYESISNSILYPGIESWLPLFCDNKSTIFDYLDNPILIIDNEIIDYLEDFEENINSQFINRLNFDEVEKGGDKYFALKPDKIFLNLNNYKNLLNTFDTIKLTTLNDPKGTNLYGESLDSFYLTNLNNQINYEYLKDTITKNSSFNNKLILACSSEGSKVRLIKILNNQGISNYSLEEWSKTKSSNKFGIGVCVLNLGKGFSLGNNFFISEQDIFGEKFYRTRKVDNKNFLKDVSNINPGDLIVHIDHGLGKFTELTNIKIEESEHECLLLEYRNNDRLYLPVENLEMLSKYNSHDENITLDRLGGISWKNKTKKIKENIMILAKDLIDIAAKRKVSKAIKFNINNNYYDDFCSRFSYEETDDQLNSIDSVLSDLSNGIPMDRLICGDVGFGKTEVAIRASFLVALESKQVAILTPTTLLTRQHYETFKDRFNGLPINIVELSRLTKKKNENIEKINNGEADIIIGTHSLLSEKINFKDLGLLIIDEEQHFGVRHKEKLKKLRSDVHVLTLTATPIPRTMQLAMTGVKDLSIIATPPIDRRSIETFVFKKDNIVIKEALIREKSRGGQSFYIVPRIKDIREIEEFIKKELPEIKYVIAHGQMSSTMLENRMHDFYKGEYDILISTSIIESGLDLPNANTIIIHKANLFGLSQLYQIRGRVGRSNIKAYAYITYESDFHLGDNALKRLEAIQSLNSLGSGFNLASYDLDIRGSGNILGEQQSGHIKEIGIELYQEMLEETISELKNNNEKIVSKKWSPKISINLPVLIPEVYIEDINIRMEIYRKLSNIKEESELELMEIELIDRFGKFPKEIEILLRVILIKIKCKNLNIETIKDNKNGFIIQFKDNIFNNSEGLIHYISQSEYVKLHPDEKLIFMNNKGLNILDFIDSKLEDLNVINVN